MNLAKFASFALCAALAGTLSGIPSIATAQTINDENQHGSFLVFPKFDIRADTKTTLRITNTADYKTWVQINYVCPGVKNVNQFCAALNNEIELTGHETRVIDVGDSHPPCLQGYVVAFAEEKHNTPWSWNALIGSYKITSGRASEADNAIALQSVKSHKTTLGTGGKLYFGGTNADYTSLSSQLSTDFRAVTPAADAKGEIGSRLTLLTLDVLAGMQNPPAVAFVDFWNAAEVPFSTSVEFICWFDKKLDDIDANFLADNLGTTHGSMEITGFPNCPIPGACPPLNPYDPTLLGSITEYCDGDVTGRTLWHDNQPKNTAYQPR